MALTKEQILSADDLPLVRVDTPEWGAGSYVMIEPFDGDGRDWYDQLQSSKRWPRDDDGKLLEGDWKGLRAAAVARQLRDEQRNSLGFSELDVVALGRKCGAPIDRIFGRLQKISGLDPDATEDAEKNSETGPSAGSGSS